MIVDYTGIKTIEYQHDWFLRAYLHTVDNDCVQIFYLYNGRVFVFLNNTCNHLRQKKSHVFLKKLLTVNLVYSLQLLHELKMEVHV